MCVRPLETRTFPSEGFELVVQHDRRLDSFGRHCRNRLCCSHRLAGRGNLTGNLTVASFVRGTGKTAGAGGGRGGKGKKKSFGCRSAPPLVKQKHCKYITEEMTAARFFGHPASCGLHGTGIH